MSIILGFDVSSSTVGWGALKIENDEISFIDSGFIKPLKKVSIIKSLQQLKTDINNIIDKINPDEIAIEDIVQFMPKKSTARTIITLAIYNRTVALACADKLGHEPKLYSVMAIRHKLKFNKKFPAKEEMPEILEKRLNISFPWIDKKVKKKGVVLTKRCDESYDVADGICVALYHVMNK